MDQEGRNRTRKKKLVEGEACVAIFWLPQGLWREAISALGFQQRGSEFLCPPYPTAGLEP